jgi:hypothetical protein
MKTSPSTDLMSAKHSMMLGSTASPAVDCQVECLLHHRDSEEGPATDAPTRSRGPTQRWEAPHRGTLLSQQTLCRFH